MENIIYIHYGSTSFDKNRNFPIRNEECWVKPKGGLWASRKNASWGWKDWCEAEEFRDCLEDNAFTFVLREGATVAVIKTLEQLHSLPEMPEGRFSHLSYNIDFEEGQKYYGRYMDDWYIMAPTKEELQDLLENIRAIATELGIHINDKKTRIVKISSTYKYLQIKYSLTSSGKVIKRINPERVTALRRKLKKLAVKVQNGEIPYENVENMFKGWMGSFYKLLSKQQRVNLITLYEELFHKSITILNKKMIITDNANKCL